jgi:hypothetical protein
METRRWTNPSQPQTLVMAVYLLYIRAALGALFGAIFSLLGLAIIAGMVAAGYGIANERKWGYWLGVGVSVVALLPYAIVVMDQGLGRLFDLDIIIGAMIPIAQLALLIHPQSREHQRIWFS